MSCISVGLVVACTGGAGGLGEFGDDGLGQSSSTQTTTSSGSSSGRTTSSTSGDVTSSSGLASSSGLTSSSGASSGASSGTTSSGGSSGTTAITCGSTTCTSSLQYCVKPCCPTEPDCYALSDGGTCITGYSTGTCNSVVGTACVKQCKNNNILNNTTPYCTTSTSTTGLEGSCSTSSSTRTITCTCF